jgi:hypothetical protein
LSYGITSIREPGADPAEGLESKEAWASGRRAGPRLFTTGLIEGSRLFYPMSLPVSSASGLDLEIERAARLDYDFIKTYERLDSPFQSRAVQAAHKLGIPITSHDLYPSAEFGIDAVEHMATGDRIIASDRLSLTGKIYEDVVQLYSHAGVDVVPTMIGGDPNAGAWFLSREGKAFKDVKQLRLLPPRVLASRYVKDAIQGAPSSVAAGPMADATLPVARLKRAGASTQPGTDTSFFNLGFGIVTELQFYVDTGFSPAEALQAGTLESARLNQVEDKLGSIEPGKLADMVVVRGDPLAHVMDVLNVDIVIKDGHIFTFDQLAAGAKLGRP